MVQEAKRTGNVSFVLRLWLETTGERPADWRWKVQHVQSGEERYCRSLEGVLEFIEGCAKVAPPQISASGGLGVSEEPGRGKDPG